MPDDYRIQWIAPHLNTIENTRVVEGALRLLKSRGAECSVCGSEEGVNRIEVWANGHYDATCAECWASYEPIALVHLNTEEGEECE